MENSKALSRLVNLARSGDEDAFVQLYNMFSKHIYYNALKVTGNENDAKDVLQEVMLRLYSQLDQIQNPRGLPLYLYRATYHLSIDLWRQRQDGNLLEDDLQLQRALGAEKRREFLPEEYAEIQEQRDYIICLLDDLHPNYKAVLLMFYYDGLTLKEIAAAMQISANTARVKLQNGREALKKKIEQDKQQKRGALRAMSVPALTRIMQYNADNLFTEDINEQAWQGIAQRLGLGAATTVGVTAAATAATAAGVATTTVSATQMVTFLLTTSVISAALLGAGTFELQENAVPTGALPYLFTYAISSGQLPGLDINYPEAPLQSGSHTSGELHLPDTDAEPHNALESAEDPTSAELSGGERDLYFSISFSTDTLVYPVGTTLTLEQIYTDAGITGYHEDLQNIKVLGLDSIDTAKPDEHIIYLLFPSTEKKDVFTLALIVVIES